MVSEMELCCSLYINKTTRTFEHRWEAWRVLVLQKYEEFPNLQRIYLEILRNSLIFNVYALRFPISIDFYLHCPFTFYFSLQSGGLCIWERWSKDSHGIFIATYYLPSENLGIFATRPCKSLIINTGYFWGGRTNLARAPAESWWFSPSARTDADDDSLPADGSSAFQR